MKQTFSTTGLKSLFDYPFRQANWLTKLGILGLMIVLGMFIPVIPWIVAAGYLAELLRRTVLEDGEPDLPAWSNWEKLFIDGLRVLGVSLFYYVPFFLITFTGFGIYLGSIFTAIGLGNGGHSGAAGPLMLMAIGVLFTTISCGLIFSLIVGAVLPVPLTHVVVEKSFGALFQVRAWWRILRANLGGYLVVGLLMLGLFGVLQLVSQLLVFVLVLFFIFPVLILVFSPYVGVVWVRMIGQAYREGKELLAADRVESVAAVEPGQPDL